MGTSFRFGAKILVHLHCFYKLLLCVAKVLGSLAHDFECGLIDVTLGSCVFWVASLLLPLK